MAIDYEPRRDMQPRLLGDAPTHWGQVRMTWEIVAFSLLVLGAALAVCLLMMAFGNDIRNPTDKQTIELVGLTYMAMCVTVGPWLLIRGIRRMRHRGEFAAMGTGGGRPTVSPRRGAMIGAALLVFGLIATGWSYHEAASSPAGGTYTIWYGPILVGAISMIYHLARAANS